MSVIAVQADAAEGALARDPALVERPLLAIRETARTALADMRRVLGGLRSGEKARLAPEPGLASRQPPLANAGHRAPQSRCV
jgi:signal transduction histidine kinase